MPAGRMKLKQELEGHSIKNTRNTAEELADPLQQNSVFQGTVVSDSTAITLKSNEKKLAAEVSKFKQSS